MPDKLRKTDTGKYLDRYRTQKHVEAQAALDLIQQQINTFAATLRPLVGKGMRSTADEAAAKARGILGCLVLNDLWAAMDVGEPVGEPWDSILRKKIKQSDDEPPEEDLDEG